MDIHQQFQQQQFSNGYAFIDGVRMNEENGERFQIPPDVLKRYVATGHFIEVRIDSPRFSAHCDAPEKCTCDSCSEETSKPVLSHQEPQSLSESAGVQVPSRGWGEDFWIQVLERQGDYFLAIVDNYLQEERLHEIEYGQVVAVHADHILAIHPSHRQELVMGMTESDLRELVAWLGSQ